MADSTLNCFVAYGTNAERLAFTPDPPSPASGPDQGYLWYETDTGDFYAWDGSAWDQVNTGGGGGTGNFIGKQVITATGAGTYTPTAGTASIVIELQAGGGGGGSVVQPTAGNRAMGAGGGGGGWLSKRLTADFSGASYSVGAGGTGGASGAANAGVTGGNTTFTDTAGSPTVYTASGGVGGVGGSASTTVPQVGATTAGGAATGGDENIPGASSGFTNAEAIDRIVSGRGGYSHKGFGGSEVVINSGDTSAAGNNGTGKGSGGSGAAASGTGISRAGGNGADGCIVIWEYGS